MTDIVYDCSCSYQVSFSEAYLQLMDKGWVSCPACGEILRGAKNA